MKKILSLLLIGFIILVHINSAKAQTTAPYVFIRPVFTFPTNSVKLDENTFTIGKYTYTQGIYGSYAKGVSIQAGIGKMISSTFGFEVAAEYLRGNKINSELTYDDTIQIAGNASEGINSVLIKPALILRNSGDLLTIYSRLGFAIAVYSSKTAVADLSLRDSNVFLQLNTAAVEDVSAKLGFTAAFGISFRISQSMSIAGEITGQMLSLNIKSGHYTKFIENGKNMLPELSPNDKQWIYVKTTVDPQTDPNIPQKKISQPANFSYIGVGIALNYYF